jgi:hypothetical protein
VRHQQHPPRTRLLLDQQDELEQRLRRRLQIERAVIRRRRDALLVRVGPVGVTG